MAVPFSDAVRQQYYQGWNDMASMQQDWAATQGSKLGSSSSGGGGGSSGGGYSAPDPIEAARRANEFIIQQNQPAVQTLQSQIPGMQESVTKGIENLKSKGDLLTQKYDALIASIKGSGQQEITQNQNITTAEYGKRGIPISSGMAQQGIENVISPIRKYWSGQELSATQNLAGSQLDLEALIIDLQNKGREGVNAVQNAIAQLQAGSPATAVTQGLQWAKNQLDAQAAAATQAWNEKVYKETTLPASQASVAYTNAQTNKANKSNVTTTPAAETKTLQDIFKSTNPLDSYFSQSYNTKANFTSPLDNFWK